MPGALSDPPRSSQSKSTGKDGARVSAGVGIVGVGVGVGDVEHEGWLLEWHTTTPFHIH